MTPTMGDVPALASTALSAYGPNGRHVAQTCMHGCWCGYRHRQDQMGQDEAKLRCPRDGDGWVDCTCPRRRPHARRPKVVQASAASGASVITSASGRLFQGEGEVSDWHSVRKRLPGGSGCRSGRGARGGDHVRSKGDVTKNKPPQPQPLPSCDTFFKTGVAAAAVRPPRSHGPQGRGCAHPAAVDGAGAAPRVRRRRPPVHLPGRQVRSGQAVAVHCSC